MIDIKDKKDCCGCTACQSVCSQNAITMKPDNFGFLYPEVDQTRCIDCGLCDKVCAFNDDYDKSLNLSEPFACAARHKDMTEMMKSRSGGVFAALSDYVLENDGIVYGVGYTGHFVVTHKRATTKEERDEFRGSKYVQSDLTGIFRQVKEDLKRGLMVMFSGTPCQTSGLNSYVGKKLREKLYLVDVVCHGVPGPKMWEDYLIWLEKKYGRKIEGVDFRDKVHFGWRAHVESYKFEGLNNVISVRDFTNTFYKHIAFRHSCGNCHFCNLTRPSDVTIADYWGSERTDAHFNADNKGCSLVLCNTEKGLDLFEIIKDKLNVIPSKLENVMQRNLQQPSEFHPKRQEFEVYYTKNGIEKAINKYVEDAWYVICHKFFKRCVGKVMRIAGMIK